MDLDTATPAKAGHPQDWPGGPTVEGVDQGPSLALRGKCWRLSSQLVLWPCTWCQTHVGGFDTAGQTQTWNLELVGSV